MKPQVNKVQKISIIWRLRNNNQRNFCMKLYTLDRYRAVSVFSFDFIFLVRPLGLFETFSNFPLFLKRFLLGRSTNSLKWNTLLSFVHRRSKFYDNIIISTSAILTASQSHYPLAFPRYIPSFYFKQSAISPKKKKEAPPPTTFSRWIPDS